MAKLYPPNIPGTIPAFSGTVLTVPFSMNRAVGKIEVAGFSIKIRTISGVNLGYKKVIRTTQGFKDENNKAINAYFDLEKDYEVKVDLSDIMTSNPGKFNVGQYYKIQLAYIDTNYIVGYYSTVGVVKYTTAPTVFIEKLQYGIANPHNYTYTGIYRQTEEGSDSTEKLYSSYFVITNGRNEVIYNSGEKIHNNSIDTLPNEAHEVVEVNQDLPLNESFYIQFITTTVNGMIAKTQKYRITQRRSITPAIYTTLNAELDYNEAQIKLTFNKVYNSALQKQEVPLITGSFLISRASSKNNLAWEPIKYITLTSIQPVDWSFCDRTIEHGVTYQYSLQQYNDNGIFSDRILSNQVDSDFEDSFLFDGDKQLKIRFNPKVSSFKRDILETKTDTIGSQFPFFSRNGRVNYREFNLSGLISYQMDNAEQFMPKETLGITQNLTNLVRENLYAERIFKNAVLDWLTDGKPKMLKTPAEGNFIVRLMNTSLSPTDSLGRMLHTFSCSAYEIADFTMENLEYYNLIDTSEIKLSKSKYLSVDIHEEVMKIIDDEDKIMNQPILLNLYNALSVRFEGVTPGTMIGLTLKKTNNEQKIWIGSSGTFYYTAEEDNEITDLRIYPKGNKQLTGICTYEFKTASAEMFGIIASVIIKDVPALQIRAPFRDIFQSIADVKTDVLTLDYIRFLKKDVKDIYINKVWNAEMKNLSMQERLDLISGKNITFYWDAECQQSIQDGIENLDPLTLYNIHCKKEAKGTYNKFEDPYSLDDSKSSKGFTFEGYYIDKNPEDFMPFTGICYDVDNNMFFIQKADTYSFTINAAPMSIEDTGYYELQNVDLSTSINVLGQGVITELGYSAQVMTYIFEEQSGATRQASLAYASACTTYNNLLNQGAVSAELDNARRIMASTYQTLLQDINRDIKRYQEENGI